MSDKQFMSRVKNLEITKAAFYLRESMSQKTDYLEMKDKLFGDKTGERVIQ